MPFVQPLFSLPQVVTLVPLSLQPHQVSLFEENMKLHLSYCPDKRFWMQDCGPTRRHLNITSDFCHTMFWAGRLAILQCFPVLLSDPCHFCFVNCRENILSCGHQVRQVCFLRVLRFPPIRRPLEHKHRCQLNQV